MPSTISELPRIQYLDVNGKPLAGGKLFIYSAGTNTKINSYTTSALSVANSNPIILNSLGMTPNGVWLPSGTSVKYVLAPSTDTDPPSAPIFTEDNVNIGSNAYSTWNQVTGTLTYISATSFSMSGDQTPVFSVNKRMKSTVSGGTAYSTVISSTYASGITTVVVVNDDISLDSGLSACYTSVIDYTHTQLPEFYADLITQKNTGWTPVRGETWVYSGGYSLLNTWDITITGDVTSKYAEGMKIKFDQDIPTPLTSYWTFNTNSTDSVGTAVATDTAMTYTAGKFGNAATFNGTTSKIVITDNANLKGTSEWTFGCWLKTGSSGTQGIYQCFSNNGTQNTSGFLIWISNGLLKIYTGDNTTVSDGYSISQGTRYLADNVWHQIFVTFKNGIIQLYTDGELDCIDFARQPAYTTPVYTGFGAIWNNATPTYFFNGQIEDALYIKGFALDQQTIYKKYVANTAFTNNTLTITNFAFISKQPIYSGGFTQLVVFTGTDYKISNSSLNNISYSSTKAPYYFPLIPLKWSIGYNLPSLTTITTPAAGVNYTLTSNFTCPVGQWNIGYRVCLGADSASSIVHYISSTLSTINSGETIKSLSYTYFQPIAYTVAVTPVTNINSNFKAISSAPLYLLIACSNAGTSHLYAYGSPSNNTNSYIYATSAYL